MKGGRRKEGARERLGGRPRKECRAHTWYTEHSFHHLRSKLKVISSGSLGWVGLLVVGRQRGRAKEKGRVDEDGGRSVGRAKKLGKR